MVVRGAKSPTAGAPVERRFVPAKGNPALARAEILPGQVREQPDGSLLVRMRLASAYPVRRFGYFDGRFEEFDEVLSFERGAHRSERLDSGRCPLLDTHSTWSLESVLGRILGADAGAEAPAWDRKAETLEVTVSVSGVDSLKELRQKIRERTITNSSIGYRVFQYRDVTEKGAARRRLLAIDWEAREGSFVPIGADPTTSTRSDQAPPDGDPVVVLTDPKARDMEPDELETREDAAPATPPAATATATPPAAPAAPAAPDARAEGARAEFARQKGIRAKLELAKIPLEGKLARKLLDDPAMTLERATESILDAVTRRDEAEPITAQTETVPGGEAEAKTIRALEDSILARSGILDVLPEKERAEVRARLQGNPFVHRTLLQAGEAFLARVHGARGLDALAPRELARRILFTRGADVTRAPGYHVTTDFASVLANIATKGLQAAYTAAEDTWSQWTKRGTLPDFKEAKRVGIGDAPRLLRKYEGAEYIAGAVGERGEPIQLVTYGRSLNFSRESIVNDDLDAFGKFPTAFGVSSKELIADLVYALLTANAAMADGFALFDTTNHGNLVSAGGNAFTSANAVVAISNSRAQARLQKGIAPGNGEVAYFISVSLKHLRVPTALETIAQQVVSTIQPALVGSVNPFVGTFSSVMAEPRLDAASAAAFYLMADPARFDNVEVAFLRGEEGPVMESRLSWEADGVEMKCRLDVGTAAIEYRGLYKNNGAT